MNAEQLALYELHSAAVNYIWTFWPLRGRRIVARTIVARVIWYRRWLDANKKTTNQRRPTMLYWLRRPHPLRAEYAIVPRTKWGVVALPGGTAAQGGVRRAWQAERSQGQGARAQRGKVLFGKFHDLDGVGAARGARPKVVPSRWNQARRRCTSALRARGLQTLRLYHLADALRVAGAGGVRRAAALLEH